MSQRRLTARDFKDARRGGFDLGRWRDFGIGLGAGLLVALVIFIGDRRARPTTEPAAPQPGKRTASASGDAGAGGDAAAGAAERFDFYEMLPKFEVVVPEKEKDVRPGGTPSAALDKPGTYVLQAGSYRDFAEADRIRAQLALQGIESKVQKVSVDTDTWHRVRIGPISELEELNRIRERLHEADIDVLLIRVPE